MPAFHPSCGHLRPDPAIARSGPPAKRDSVPAATSRLRRHCGHYATGVANKPLSPWARSKTWFPSQCCRHGRRPQAVWLAPRPLGDDLPSQPCGVECPTRVERVGIKRNRADGHSGPVRQRRAFASLGTARISSIRSCYDGYPSRTPSLDCRSYPCPA